MKRILLLAAYVITTATNLASQPASVKTPGAKTIEPMWITRPAIPQTPFDITLPDQLFIESMLAMPPFEGREAWENLDLAIPGGLFNEPGLSMSHIEASIGWFPMRLAEVEAAMPALAEAHLFDLQAKTQDRAANAYQEANSLKYQLPSKTQDPSAKAYQEAYNLILDQKWAEAQKAMDNFIAKFPRNSWTDAARYWKCYTKEKRGESLEDTRNSSNQSQKATGRTRQNRA
ncbi:MAG: hypothetical protein HW374_1108 [Bacteroidetes bacterium]|nr:hypothetical protein [Bacteroidota bacterium]